MVVEIRKKSTGDIVWYGTLDEYHEARRNGRFWAITLFDMRFKI